MSNPEMYRDEDRTHADELIGESVAEQALVDAHDAVIEDWADDVQRLTRLRERMLLEPEYVPSEFRNEAERRFVSQKQAKLAGDDA